MPLKLRTYLILLVSGAIAPVVLVAVIFAAKLWDMQREAFDQRLVERVSAMRVALDVEIESIFGALEMVAAATARGDEAGLARFHEQLPFQLAHNPAWALIRLTAPDGTALGEQLRSTTPAVAQLDPATAARVQGMGKPAASGLVALPDGRNLMTYFAVPVQREGTLIALLYVGVEHRHWLAFLQKHPIGTDETLTLIDGAGRIVARTLNDAQWAGKESSPEFLAGTQSKTDGALALRSLEGQPFHAAYSRSRVIDWVLSTGVPVTEVETPLRISRWALGGGLLLAIAAAFVAGSFLARYLAASIGDLAAGAEAVGSGGAPPAARRMAIKEAERARIALVAAGRQLAERETALHEALKREAQAGAELQQAKRSDAFLARLAHDIRNPVGAISTALEVWRRAPSGDAAARLADLAQRQVARLTALADELADAAQVNAGTLVLEKRPLDLQHAVQDALAACEQRGRLQRRTFQRRLQHVIVDADPGRVEQLLAALLDHACAASPREGPIDIVLDAAGRDARLQIRSGGFLVEPDGGRNIDHAGNAARRSAPDPSAPVTNLELDIAEGLATLHDGTLSVRSLAGAPGILLELRLPRTVGGPGDADAPGAAGLVAPQRVVVVEDVADNRESVVELLRGQGHTVAVAADGPGGLAAIASGSVDIALVDLGLPGFDGLELARRVREDPRCAGVRLVALTGYARDRDRTAAYEAGFDGFLVKPFDLGHFEQELRERG